MAKISNISAKAVKSSCDVVRLTYSDGGRPIGTARLLADTIGDITVYKSCRRKGYGIAILRGLIRRGGRVAFAGSQAGATLLMKCGFETVGSGFYQIKEGLVNE